jgi:CelD/BcsL family acetyltransferase involved in cellulose biosynthesis
MLVAGKPSVDDFGRTKSPTVEWMTDEARFAELASAWDALLPDDARPFDLHCWYSTWWNAFSGSGELAVCTTWSGDELEGVCPLVRRGNHLSALANSHSPVFRPLASSPAAMDDLMATVTQAARASLVLPALPSEDPSVKALGEATGRASMLRCVEPVHTSPIVETDGDFDAWRASSKPRWGAPLERFRRKMGRDHEARFEILEQPRDLEAELDIGFAVEGSGWKGRAGTAILSTPETERFYRGLARAFHERGALRLTRIVLDDTVAAFDLCVLRNNRLYLLKTGYDERFSKLAPGLVLRLCTIERCFELGYEAHELLGEDSEWKLKFATTERRHLDLRAYRRTPLGGGRYAYRAMIRPRLKRAYRSMHRTALASRRVTQRRLLRRRTA